MKRVNIGDLIEIPTAQGLAYAQVTHNHPTYGFLIRVLEGFDPVRPAPLSLVAQRKTTFVAFFPVSAAVHRGIFEIVGTTGVPETSKRFPTFRISGGTDRNTNRVAHWGLWDGDKESDIKRFGPEHRRLPILGIVNDTMLIDRIESGWLPENDPS